MNNNWVMTFGMAHAPLSLTYFPFKKRTYRLIINSAISGVGARIRLSNKYSDCAVTIEKVSIARCSQNGELIGDIKKLTFGSEKSVTIGGGERILSDCADISVSPDDYLAITFLVTAGDLKSGNAVKSGNLIFCDGDKAYEKVIPDQNRSRTKLIKAVTGLMHLQQPMPIPLVEAAELDNRENASAIMCFGDSLMQQGMWTSIFEDKIREKFGSKYSVITMSIIGNRLMYDCSPKFILKGFFGVSAFKRVDENVFDYDNISHAIICIGINDLLQPDTYQSPKEEFPAFEAFCNDLTRLFSMFSQHKIKTLAMNYLPVGKSPDWRDFKEPIRLQLNEWLKAATIYDAFCDLNAILEDKTNPRFAISEYICKDKLHPNKSGGEAIANAIPLDFFN